MKQKWLPVITFLILLFISILGGCKRIQSTSDPALSMEPDTILTFYSWASGSEKAFTCLLYTSLMPKMAIVDADNMMSQPKGLTSASGVDVLTHALEAYASVMASDYTDGLALKAMKNVLEYLPTDCLLYTSRCVYETG